MINFKNFIRFQAVCHSPCLFTSALGNDNHNNNRHSLLSIRGFCGGSDGKESACNAEDVGLIPRLGRSPGKGNGYPLQYSWLENSMEKGAWWALWGHKDLDLTEQLTHTHTHTHTHNEHSLNSRHWAKHLDALPNLIPLINVAQIVTIPIVKMRKPCQVDWIFHVLKDTAGGRRGKLVQKSINGEIDNQLYP